ncbi:hypothetical protein N2152v2_001364 [Parachlorella kessleri]
MISSQGRRLPHYKVLQGPPVRAFHFSRCRIKLSRLLVRAALPIDPVTFTQLASAAAASSLLTAAWLRSRLSTDDSSQTKPDRSQPAAQQQGQVEAQQPAEAHCVQQVWDAAWAAFESQPGQQPPGDAPADSSQHPFVDEPVASKPLLLLQGVKGSERVQLLALALAALEQQVTQLLPGALLVLKSTQQWRQVCTALVANASFAAAAAWLGYIPEELQAAVQQQYRGLDPATLAAAGIQPPPSLFSPQGRGTGVTVTTEAPAAAAPAVEGTARAWFSWKRRRQRKASSSGTGNDGSSSGGSSSGEGGSVSRQTRLESFYWVGLDEKLPLYSSVLRLLRSNSIAGQEEAGQHPGQSQRGQIALQVESCANVALAGDRQPSLGRQQGSSPCSASNLQAGGLPGEAIQALPRATQPAAATGPALVAVPASSSFEARHAARSRLQTAVDATELRGWRATSAGARSSSQLLSLAPAVLHDMAVMVAEAVAAGYLADVEAGLDPAAAVTAAASLQKQAGSGRPAEHNRSGTSSSRSRGSPTEGVAGATAAAELLAADRHGANSLVASTGSSRSSSLTSQSVSMTGSSTSGGALLPLEASYWPTFLHRQLASTRQRQRFTNQVVVQRWLHRQFHSVAAMYEDRMDLFGLGPGATLQVRRAPLRRVGELNRLQGGRYWMSLLLELADLAAPALKALWSHASAFLSWLLVRLIGQSLGLIYKGIKLSLDPTQQQQQQQKGRKARKEYRSLTAQKKKLWNEARVARLLDNARHSPSTFWRAYRKKGKLAKIESAVQWFTYFKGLFSDDKVRPATRPLLAPLPDCRVAQWTNAAVGLNTAISSVEVESAVKKLRRNKASGLDGGDPALAARPSHSVAATYEDRMDLFGLGPRATLQVCRVPLRRVGELNRSRGGHYWTSLLLELADLAAPALKALWTKASAFVSWRLVRLIEQSLGLV